MENSNPTQARRRDRGSVLGGLVLVVLGLLFLADNFLPDVRFADFWPLILVAIGIGLLWRSRDESRK